MKLGTYKPQTLHYKHMKFDSEVFSGTLPTKDTSGYPFEEGLQPTNSCLYIKWGLVQIDLPLMPNSRHVRANSFVLSILVSTLKFDVNLKMTSLSCSNLCSILGLPIHKAQILRVLEHGNSIGLGGEHRQLSSRAAHVDGELFYERQENEPFLALLNFKAHLCADACANFCAVASNW